MSIALTVFNRAIDRGPAYGTRKFANLVLIASEHYQNYRLPQ